MTDLRGKNVLVVGMAKSGLAAVELLLAKGAVVTAMDQKRAAELGVAAERLAELNVPLLVQTEAAVKDINLVVLSPGVPADDPAVNAARRAGIKVIGEVELASYYLEGPVIGITGSNGKTTTTALTSHIFRESFLLSQVGGNIGTPPTSMVESSKREQWNILELSSFQLETIETFRARVAVVLNVTPDHLDRHHTFEEYANAKARIFENQQAGDWAVLNADDPVCVGYANRTKGKPVWFSLSRPVTPGLYVYEHRILFDGDELMPIKDIPLAGMHNVENVMAAAAAARIAGSELGHIAAAIRTFPGVEHRLEFVRERQGVRYYNDSKATNVDATQKALDSFPGGLWVILGGKDKGSDYTVLGESLRRKARGILLIGAASPIIAQQLGPIVPVTEVGTLGAAVEHAASKAAPGDVVLLAPACASFDQFNNFEHRGRVFKDLVNAL